MAPQFEGVERTRFPTLLALGVGLGAVVVIVAFIVDADYGWPLLILLAIAIAAAFAFRLIAGSNRDDADSSDNLPRQGATRGRALGDTPEAHDEINPHDFAIDSPGRDAAEEQAGGMGGTTRGNLQGGAAGEKGPAEGDQRFVGSDEQDEARVRPQRERQE